MTVESNRKGNRALKMKREAEVPSYRIELGNRLLSIINMFPSKRAAAEIAQVTAEQLGNYVRGDAKPPLEVAARLAEWGKISLDWLWTGRGERLLPKRAVESASARPLDEKLLQATIQGVEEMFADRQWHLPSAKKAELVVLVYLEAVAAGGVDRNRIERFFKLAS